MAFPGSNFNLNQERPSRDTKLCLIHPLVAVWRSGIPHGLGVFF